MYQDIWKFNPAEYIKKWTPAEGGNWFKKKLVETGLKYMDRLGTPVITRTPTYYR